MSTLCDPAIIDESPVDRSTKCAIDGTELTKYVPERAYLSGPMRGIPEYNYPAFNWAAKWLRDEVGAEVISPAEMDLEGCDTSDPPSFFRRDISVLVELSKYPRPMIVLLDGWNKSEGSTIEVAVGQVLNIPIYKLIMDEEGFPQLSRVYTTHAPWKAPWLEPVFEDNCHTLAAEADYLVHGPRSGSYGPPIEDFSKVAALASTLLYGKLKKPLDPEDIALFMVAIKLSREIHKHKRDNLVDMIGYILTLQSCIDWRRKHQKETTCPTSAKSEETS